MYILMPLKVPQDVQAFLDFLLIGVGFVVTPDILTTRNVSVDMNADFQDPFLKNKVRVNLEMLFGERKLPKEEEQYN